MKRSVIVLMSVAVLTGFASLASAETKIGVVSIARLASESPQAKSANDALRAEFTPRQTEIEAQAQALKTREDKYSKDAPTMSDVQRAAAEKSMRDGERDLQLKQSSFQDDLNARRQEQQDKIQRVLMEEVQAFAKAQGYDLILADGVLYATGALDVTGPVLLGMQNHKDTPTPPTPGKAPAAGKAPASTTKP